MAARGSCHANALPSTVIEDTSEVLGRGLVVDAPLQWEVAYSRTAKAHTDGYGQAYFFLLNLTLGPSKVRVSTCQDRRARYFN